GRLAGGGLRLRAADGRSGRLDATGGKRRARRCHTSAARRAVKTHCEKSPPPKLSIPPAGRETRWGPRHPRLSGGWGGSGSLRPQWRDPDGASSTMQIRGVLTRLPRVTGGAKTTGNLTIFSNEMSISLPPIVYY